MSTPARLSLAAALATILSSLALVPLVQGLRWFGAVLIVVLAVSAAGAAMRQLVRWGAAVVAFQLVVLVLAVTVLFLRDAAFLVVIPGPQTVSAFSTLLGDGLTVTREQGAPVEDTRGLLLLVTAAIGLVGLTVDLIAATLRRPAAAGLPLLAVYCVPAAVLPDGLDWQWFLGAAAGYLVLLAADSADRIRGWGRVVGGRRARQGAAGELHRFTSGDRRVAAFSLVLALLVPLLIPGLGDRLIPGGGGGGGNGEGKTISTVNPILKLRERLTSRDNTTVITYTTTVSKPEPLRLVTADEFTGELWRPREYKLPQRQRVQDGLASPPGLTAKVPATAETTDVSVLGLAQVFLPLPYPTQRVDITGDWRYDAGTLNVVGVETDTRNRRYVAQHELVTPTAEMLNDAGDVPPALQDYLKLPRLPKVVQDTAERIGGSGTPYERAVRIQAWFRTAGGFQYAEEPSGSGDDSGLNAVVAFLQNKRGYCVQFASAMSVMARSLGIPARVAIGFLPGNKQSDGRYAVSLRDAHAWPELFFSGVGWVRFEPTPGQRSGAPPGWSVEDSSQPEPSTSATAPSSSVATPVAPEAPEQNESVDDDRSFGQRVTDWVTAIPWQVVLGVVLLLLLAGVPPVAAAVRRRLRRGRAGTRIGRAEAAWDELRERLADLSVPWVTSRTPRVFASWLEHEYLLSGDAKQALARLVAELELARYAPPDRPGGRGMDELTADVETIRRSVAASVGPAQRRRAWWLPPSGFAALSGAPYAPGTRAADVQPDSPVESATTSASRDG